MLALSIYIAVCVIVTLALTSSPEYRRQARAKGKNPERLRWVMVAKSPFRLPVALLAVIIKLPVIIARAIKHAKED